VLGLVHAGRFTLGIGDDPVIAAGDRLLIAEAAPRQRRHVPRLPARVRGGNEFQHASGGHVLLVDPHAER
jgi:hypothetical protein